MLSAHHLHDFSIVTEAGGVARAAERLDMAVQTIGEQVASCRSRCVTSCSEGVRVEIPAFHSRRASHHPIVTHMVVAARD